MDHKRAGAMPKHETEKRRGEILNKTERCPYNGNL